MAAIVWTEPALNDLDEIAEYIEFDDPDAAARFVARVIRHVRHLAKFPRIGSILPENPNSSYRQILEPPCRIFYRIEDDTVLIVHVIRSERLLRMDRLERY